MIESGAPGGLSHPEHLCEVPSVPFYQDSEQLYASFRALFSCVEASYPRVHDAIRAARLVIRFRLSQPTAEIYIDGRQNPVRATFGPRDVRPDLDIELAADTLHRILLGELTLTKALGSGLMKVRGPIFKTMTLGDLFVTGQRCYPGVLKEQKLM